MSYRKDFDETVHGPFRLVIEKALMLEVGETLQYSADSVSVKMAEQRLREYLRFMKEKDPTTDFPKMFIIRPLFGLDRVEIERRYPKEGILVNIVPGMEGEEE